MLGAASNLARSLASFMRGRQKIDRPAQLVRKRHTADFSEGAGNPQRTAARTQQHLGEEVFARNELFLQTFSAWDGRAPFLRRDPRRAGEPSPQGRMAPEASPDSMESRMEHG